MTKKGPGERKRDSDGGAPGGEGDETKLAKMAHDSRGPRVRPALGRHLPEIRSFGVVPEEKEWLVAPAADDELVGRISDRVSSDVVVRTEAVVVGERLRAVADTIRHPSAFATSLKVYLGSIEANARLPLGRTGFLTLYVAWKGLAELVTEASSDADILLLQNLARTDFFNKALLRIDQLIERQALNLRQGVEEACPVWFLYDILKRISVAIKNQKLVDELDEKWEVVQYIHAKQIARVDAPYVAQEVAQRFPSGSEFTMLDVGARTGDAFAELIRILSSSAVGDRKIDATALDLHPKTPMLAERFKSDSRFAGLPAVPNVEVKEGNILHLDKLGLPRQKVVCAWNILHKLDEPQHLQAVAQISALQEAGDVLICHMPYYDDKPAADRDDSEVSRDVFEGIDTGNGSIRGEAYWADIFAQNGYRLLKTENVHTKTGNLDSFAHKVYVLEKL